MHQGGRSFSVSPTIRFHCFAAPAVRPAGGDLWPARGWGTATPASVGLDEQILNALGKDLAEGKFLLMDSFVVFRCVAGHRSDRFEAKRLGVALVPRTRNR